MGPDQVYLIQNFKKSSCAFIVTETICKYKQKRTTFIESAMSVNAEVTWCVQYVVLRVA